LTDRLLIVGWDGADWEILDDLLTRGCLPTVETMIRDGARGNLDSTIPSHSWAAWTSFLTGLHPASHGVYDFVERHPTEPQRRVPVGSASIKAPTFLETLSEHGLEVRSANVPVTFPPFPVNGRLISGVAIPHGAPFVHPAEWSGELERRAPFPINGMEWGRFREDPSALIAEVRRLVEERTASYRVLLEGDWNVAVCVFVAPDRLQHPMGNHLLPSHPDFPRCAETPNAEAIRDVFRTLDRSLAALIETAGEGSTVVLMSDHGFRPVERLSNLSRLLERLGFAAPARTASATMGLRRSGLARAIAGTRLGHAIKRRIKAPSTVDWSRTRAYQAVSGGGINVNLRGREPDGTVAPGAFDDVRNELRDALLAYRDEETGEPIVGQVRFREDLPSGPFSDLAPDLIASPTARWSFAHSDSISSPARWPSASHRTRGIVVASGGRTRPGSLGDRYIADLGATALAFCGVPADGLDGRVIDEVAGEAAERSAVTVDAHLDAQEPRRRFDRGDSGMSDEDNEVVAQHLRDLGYIE
jgi:predicted AlkP superfamily phosphohydrolase/phosphomutase